PVKHGIITLAYVVEVDGEEYESGELRANPGHLGKEIDPRALEVNGITREEIATYPTPHGMKRELEMIMGRYVDKYRRDDKLVAGGYNVGFDVGFLRQLWTDCGDPYFGSWFAFGVIDPSQIIRFLQYTGELPEFTEGKLGQVAERFGISAVGAHDALADIRITIEIVKKIRRTA
ncbi:MAG: exonuclease domain-containing protein, partial [Spirochaetota bacterium]